jgi:hypothetical protein
MNDESEYLEISSTLEILEDQIKILSEKIKSGRIKDTKKEEIRIKWIRTLGYLCKTYAQIKESQKMEELEKEMEVLKKVLEK